MIKRLSKEKTLLIICTVLLAIIPFFWLKPGEVDLGGDSSRLYFYDPISYLKSFPLYTVAPNGFNSENTAYYLIPFILLLAALKTILFSPYLLVTFFNSFTLVAAFLSIYAIVVTLLLDNHPTLMDKRNVTFAGILGGLFYVFSPILTQAGWWSQALVVHNQFFLNPLIFYLLFAYILSKNIRYLLLTIVITFLFAPNFFLSPYLFSFYPFIILFLFLYVFIRKVKIPVKKILIVLVLFFAVHAFHFIPFLSSLFSTSGYLHNTAFSQGIFNRGGVEYFLSIAKDTKITNNLLALPQGNANSMPFYFLWVTIPILLVLGYIAQSKIAEVGGKARFVYSFLFLFFLFIDFLATANITAFALKLYSVFFKIPGFSMFRNYVGQFSHTFIFFYALLFGFSLFYIFTYLKKSTHKIALFACILILFFISNGAFIKGDNVKVISILNQGIKEPQQVTIPIRMDTKYEELLAYVNQKSTDSKYFALPLDDVGIQIIAGKDGGLYMGPPLIAYTTGKSVFAGTKGLSPFENVFLKAILMKDYDTINNIFSLFNVQNLFYNSDPAIYDSAFPGFPYAFTRKFVPYTQELYEDFINLLSFNKKQDFGQNYHLYELDPKLYLPHMYIAKDLVTTTTDSPETIVKLLSMEQGDRRIAISKDLPGETEDIIEAEKQTTLYDRFSKDKDAQIATTTVDPDLASRLAPLLILRDKIAQVGLPVGEKMVFDKTIYSVEFILRHSDSNDKKSLENSLLSYKDSMMGLITKLNMQEESFYSPLMEKIKLAQVFINDKNNLESSIEGENFLQAEKKDRLDLVENIFSSLEDILHTSVPNARTTYTAMFSQNGAYTGFVEKHANNSDYTNMSLRIDNEDIFFDKDRLFQNNWARLDTFSPHDLQKSTLVLSQPENKYPFDTALLSVINGNESGAYWVKLTASGIALDYIREIINYFSYWQPSTIYIVTFEYQTPSDSAFTQDGAWIHYKAIVESNVNGDWALLLVLKDPNMLPLNLAYLNDARGIKVRNLSVIIMEKPSIFFQSKAGVKLQKEIPKITFTKINPTKYKVSVSSATNPYVFVFLDAFNENWKIFLEKNQEKDAKAITRAYFDGQVNEGGNKNIFLDAATFETWGSKPIASDKHYQVNGYANGWYITPNDTNGKTDYTFILEMTSQRQLYILLFLSLIIVSGCGVWLVKGYVWRILKNKRKKI